MAGRVTDLRFVVNDKLRKGHFTFEDAVFDSSQFRATESHCSEMYSPETGFGEVPYTFPLSYVNCNFVVAASGSQPRVGVLVMEETSLMEICRPRVLGPFTSTWVGLHVCWLIF